MTKENIVKALIIFGGGIGLFWLIKKSKKDDATKPSLVTPTTTTTESKSFDAEKPSLENAEIVATAYFSAMQAGEPASQLSELNKECMKDFGMRCYMDKDNKLIVCDVKGDIILSK